MPTTETQLAAGTAPPVRRSVAAGRSAVVVGPGADNRGGVAAAIAAIAASTLGERYRIEVLSTTCPGSRARKAVHGLLALVRLARLCARRRVALVHVHSASGASLVRKSAFVAVARLARRPIVFHVHGGGFLSQLDGGAGGLLARLVLSRADAVVALTPYWARELEARTPTRPVVVVPNAVPADPVLRRAPASPPTIAFLGDVRRGKGVFDLVEAYARLRSTRPDVRLVLAGKAGDEDELVRRAGQLGVADGVELPGWLDGEAKRRLLAGAACFALPSHAEGLPVALIEAMAAGVPVVASRVGGIPDAVGGGEAGLLVPVGDVDALAAALASVLDDPGLASRLAAAGRARAAAEYGPAVVAARLTEVYEHVLALRAQPQVATA